MTGRDPERHTLDGFPESALRFFRVMENDRRLVASAHGLSELELRAVFRIAAAGSLTPKQLAIDLSVTSGAITGVSTRLVEAGLVTRAEHPHDRRSLHLELTDDGHAAMKVMHQDFRSMLSATGTGLSDDDLATAATVLRELADSVARHSDGRD